MDNVSSKYVDECSGINFKLNSGSLSTYTGDGYTYKNNGKEFNQKAIELFIKYDIVSEENINYLREKGKLE